MDFASILGAVIAIVKKIPGTAVSESLANAQAAAASAEAAQTASETVTSATVAETIAYLGIS